MKFLERKASVEAPFLLRAIIKSYNQIFTTRFFVLQIVFYEVRAIETMINLYKQ